MMAVKTEKEPLTVRSVTDILASVHEAMLEEYDNALFPSGRKSEILEASDSLIGFISGASSFGEILKHTLELQAFEKGQAGKVMYPEMLKAYEAAVRNFAEDTIDRVKEIQELGKNGGPIKGACEAALKRLAEIRYSGLSQSMH